RQDLRFAVDPRCAPHQRLSKSGSSSKGGSGSGEIGAGGVGAGAGSDGGSIGAAATGGTNGGATDGRRGFRRKTRISRTPIAAITARITISPPTAKGSSPRPPGTFTAVT